LRHAVHHRRVAIDLDARAQPHEFVALNFDFHPRWLEQQLTNVGLQIVARRAVSHFRVGWLKRYLPLGALVAADRALQRVGALWPPGSYALAAAATVVVEAMSGRSRRIASCYVAPDVSTGTHTRTAAMPVRLGPAGIEEVVLPSLSAVEQVALDNALML